MLLSGGSIYTPTIVNHSDLINSGSKSHNEIDLFINSKSLNNGICPLDSNGKIPLTHLPTGGQTFKGLWNSNTNTPQLLTGGIGGINGDYYIVSVSGNSLIDGINTWQIGDFIIHTGIKWERVDNPDPVLIDDNTQYKTVQNKPIFNNIIPSDPSHLVPKIYVDGIQTTLQNEINQKIPLSQKGVANGVATLDNNTKIPLSQLPQISHNDLLNKGVKSHEQIDFFIDDQILYNSVNDNKLGHIVNTTNLSTDWDQAPITTTIPLANIVSNNQLVTKEYTDTKDNLNSQNLTNHINDLQVHRVINDNGISDVDLFSAQKILALDNAQQTLINTNINNISTLQQKTNKLNINGNFDTILSYNNTVTPASVNDIVNKGYVDGLTSQIQTALRYCGTYDALNNLPDLKTAGPYMDGCYYIVNVEGSQDLGSGNILYGISDWVIRQSGFWSRIEYSSQEIIQLQSQITTNANSIQTLNLSQAAQDQNISELELKTQKYGLLGEPLSILTYQNPVIITNDNNLINKKYVDDSIINIQNSDISNLQQKTSRLDINANFINTIEPAINATYDIGTSLKKFKDGYFSNNLKIDTTLNANNLLNISNNLGLTISNDPNALISFNSTALYSNGNANRAMIMGASGDIIKSNLIINNQNIEAKDITCNKIIGNSGGPNDLLLYNSADSGIIIKDGATGEICFNGSNYAGSGPNNKTGYYLQIANSSGGIQAVQLATGGNVTGPALSTINAIPRYDNTTGTLIKNSNVLISDAGRITALEIDAKILASLCDGLLLKGDITPELNTDIINLGASNLPIARIYLNSANNGGVYIDGVKQTFGSGSVQISTLYLIANGQQGNLVGYNKLLLNTQRGVITGMVFNPATSEFVLPVGTYHLRAHGSSYNVLHTRLVLRNVTNSVYVDEEMGIGGYSPISTSCHVNADWHLTLNTTTTFELYQWTETSFVGQYGLSVGFPITPFCASSICITKL